MGWTITLGTLIDAMPAEPVMRAEVYKQTKCQVANCRSCSMQFHHAMALALRLGLLVRVGRKVALPRWDDPTLAQDLEFR